MSRQQKDVAEEAAGLKQEAVREILIGGSTQLINSLIGSHLVDEYRLLVYPVVLGSGKRLFKDGSRAPLKLVESRPLPSGVMPVRDEPEKPAGE